MTRRFIALWVAHLLGAASIHGANLLPLFITSRGGSAFTVGVLISSAALAGILARPAIGRLIDARGRRAAFALSGALNVAGFLIYQSTDAIGGVFLLGRLVHGIGIGGLFATFFTAASDLVPTSRRASGIALFGISGLAAAGIGPVVGEVALRRGGFDAFFTTFITLSALSWVMTLIIPERRVPAVSQRASAAARRPWTLDPALLRVLLVTTVFGFLVSTFMTFLPPYAERIGVGPISLFFVAYAATSVVLRLLASSVPDRVGYVVTLPPTIGCFVGAAVWIALDPTPRGLVAAGILGGTGHAFAFPTLTALVLSRSDAARRGAAIGGFTAAVDVGWLVAGPSLGFVATHTGYATAFLGAALLGAVAIGLFFVRERMRHAVAFVLLSCVVTGATYVSPSGDDSAPGTLALPRRTISLALDGLAAGDTLLLLDGVYDVASQGNANLFALSFPRARICLAAAPGAAPVLDFAGTTPVADAPFFDDDPFGPDGTLSGVTFRNWTHDRCLIRIDDADGATIGDCVFEMIAPTGTRPILVVAGVSDITIERCSFGTRPETSLFYAVTLAGDGGPGLERYRIRDCAFNDDDALADPLGRGAGIQVTAVDDLEITDCTGVNAGSNRGPQSPFHFIELRDVDEALVSDVQFRRYLGTADGEHPLHDADGVKIGSFAGQPSEHVTIERCELWGTGHGVHVGNDSHDVALSQVWCDSTYDDCVFVNDGGSDVTITGVVSHYSQDNGIDIQGDDVTVTACTIVRPYQSAVNVRATAGGTSVRDLLVYDVRDLDAWPRALVFVGTSGAWSFDHDVWFEPDGGSDLFYFDGQNQSFGAWQGAGQDPNGFYDVDPMFCDPLGRAWPIFSGAFRVSSLSPLATGSSGGGPIGGIDSTCETVGVGALVATGLRPDRVHAVPNPARLGARLDATQATTLVVMDVAGRRVRELKAEPRGRVRWDGRDARGDRVPPGVYYLRANTGARGRLIVAR